VNKKFFLGLGLGIIISSMIFYMSFIVINKTSSKNNKSVEISDEEVINRAKKLGMVAYKALPDTKQTSLSNDELIAKASELGMVFKTDEKIKETSVTVSQTQASTEVQTLEIRILGGSADENVSQTLYEAGLIEDTAAFTKYIRDKGKSTRLRAGYFKIKKDSSYDEILTILTTPPSK
jgi:hypothetical protein